MNYRLVFTHSLLTEKEIVPVDIGSHEAVYRG